MFTSFVIFMGTILGLIFGSFLNALAYRLPRGESLMTRSHCTTCFKQITAWENIPVISWLVLRGRCSGCKQYISTRYPIVELFTGIVFGLFTAVALAMSGGQPDLSYVANLVILLTFAFVGVLISLIDLDTFKIPARVIYNGFIVVLLSAIGYILVTGDQSRGWSALLYMACFAVLYALLWFVYPRGLGFGDVRLAPFVGFVLGWVSMGTAVVGFFLAWFLAFLFLIPGMFKGKVSGKSKIPFGPWIILGAFISIVVGDILFGAYL